MKSKPVVALPEVEGDLRAAMSHYASWRSDGAVHLLRKYHETIGWIEWNPESFPRKHAWVQRAILKQSYYVVYFLQEPECTVVLAVLDGRRDPKVIKDILKARK